MTACGADGETVERTVSYNQTVAEFFEYLNTYRVHPCTKCLREVGQIHS